MGCNNSSNHKKKQTAKSGEANPSDADKIQKPMIPQKSILISNHIKKYRF